MQHASAADCESQSFPHRLHSNIGVFFVIEHVRRRANIDRLNLRRVTGSDETNTTTNKRIHRESDSEPRWLTGLSRAITNLHCTDQQTDDGIRAINWFAVFAGDIFTYHLDLSFVETSL